MQKENDKLQEILDFFEFEEGWSKEEVISEIINNIKETQGYEADEIILVWDDTDLMVLSEFAEQFFDKVIKANCNVVKSFME